MLYADLYKWGIADRLSARMIERRVEGEDFCRLEKAIFEGSRGSNDLGPLKNWEQSLEFQASSDSLHQSAAGPCGFFAVLQAHIMKLRDDAEWLEVDRADVLHAVILEIMQRIGGSFAFCTDYSHENQFFSFRFCQNKSDAQLWLVESQFVHNRRCVLLLAVSYIYLGSLCDWFQCVQEPFIFRDRLTTMSFVYFLLLGSINPEVIDGLTATNYRYQAQPSIGVRVIDNDNEVTNGCWLNPEAKIFVCHRRNHYFSYEVDDNRAKIADNFGKNGQIRVVDKESLK